jgi:hypothetical protein
VTAEKAMRRRWLGAALLTVLGACAHQPQLLDRPDRVWASSKSMDAAASCVIRVLDERGRSESSLSPSFTHARRVIEPGKVYEIRPEQESAVSSETYLVRLEKIDDRITRMSLYASSPWKKQMIRAVSPCGARS